MARTQVPLNSACQLQFFLNLVDNTVTLGPTNGGGYAVFGQMTTPSLPAMDAIARAHRTSTPAARLDTLLHRATPLTGGCREEREPSLLINSAVDPAGAHDRSRPRLRLPGSHVLAVPEAFNGVGVSGHQPMQAASRTTTASTPPASSYVGLSVKDNVVFYLVPEVGPNITRFAPLADLMVDVVKAWVLTEPAEQLKSAQAADTPAAAPLQRFNFSARSTCPHPPGGCAG